MAIREVLTSFTFEQQRQMINLIGTDVGDTSLLLTPTPVVVTAINEVITGDVDLSNQTIGMDDGTLSSPSLFWDAGQGFYKVDANKIALTSSLAITGDLEVDGDITFRAGSGSGGTLTFGDLDTDNIVFNADVQSSIVPDSSANYNLGSLNKQWNNLWIDGTASIDTLTVDENATITGNLTVSSGNVFVPNTQTVVDLFDDYATTVEAFGAGTTIRIGSTTGTLTLRNPTIVGTQTSLSLFDTIATNVNAFGAASDIVMGIALGGGVGSNSNFRIKSDDTILDGDLNVNGGEILSSQNTFDFLINNTDVRIGAVNGVGNTIINNSLSVKENVDLSNSGTVVSIRDNTANSLVIREGSNSYMTFTTTDAAERVIVHKDLYIVGNLDITGTSTVINTTTLSVDDINITLGDTASPTDALANGGGITLRGTSNKTITYNNSTSRWETNIGVGIKPSTNVPQLKLEQSNAADGWKFWADGPGGGHLYIQREASAVDTTAVTILNTGKVGIGTTPNKHLHIYSSTEDAEIRLQTNTGTEQNSYITLREATGDLDFYTVQSTANMKFYTANVERLRISPLGAINFKGALVERCYVVGSTLSSSPNVYLNLGNSYLYTTQETTTSTPNITYDASITLDSVLGNGEVVSLVLMTTAAAAGYFTSVTIDGNANGANGYTINTDWLGGAAPTAGGSAGIDVYSIKIIKQSASNFNVLISQNNYA